MLNAILILLPLLMAGCVQQPAAVALLRPDPAQIVLGQTTPEAVEAIYGKPQRRSDLVSRNPTSNGVIGTNLETLTYAQVERPLFKHIYKRELVFSFLNGKLREYNFVSNFDSDSTDFDPDKARAVLSDKQVTRNEVIAAMGAPTGRALGSPGVRNLATTQDTYFYTEPSSFPTVIASPVKRLVVGYDPTDHVVSFSLQVRPASRIAP